MRVFCIALLALTLGDPVRAEEPTAWIWSGVVERVIDGDTLVAGGEVLQLRGIDAFELGQICRNPSPPHHEHDCGASAKEALESFADLEKLWGHDITCRAEERDHEGRWLAVCVGREYGDLNRRMVRTGHALAHPTQTYLAEQKSAMEALTGAWKTVFEDPWVWRKLRPSP